MSPELFLRLENNTVESRPIKGTRRREQHGEQEPLDLLRNSRDGAELSMIVDVTRNDLSRVCDAGSVQVLEHRSILTLPSLYYTDSRIEGRLKEGATVGDLLRASFPPASITGAPKIAAVKAALREERRGAAPAWAPSDGFRWPANWSCPSLFAQHSSMPVAFDIWLAAALLPNQFLCMSWTKARRKQNPSWLR